MNERKQVALCQDCWQKRHPLHPAPRHNPGDAERCHDCGGATNSGIYYLLDAAELKPAPDTRDAGQRWTDGDGGCPKCGASTSPIQRITPSGPNEVWANCTRCGHTEAVRVEPRHPPFSYGDHAARNPLPSLNPRTFVTSWQIETKGAHDHVRVWIRGQLSGEIVVSAGEGETVAQILVAGSYLTGARLTGSDARTIVEAARQGVEPPWLVKDFNALYALARDLVTDLDFSRHQLPNVEALRAQLVRLREAFETTEQIRKAARTRAPVAAAPTCCASFWDNNGGREAGDPLHHADCIHAADPRVANYDATKRAGEGD